MANFTLKANRKDSTWIFVLFIILMQDFFGLINVEAINIKGQFAFSDIWLGVFLLYFLCMMITYLRARGKNSFGVVIILLIISCVIAALQQNHYTGQPFGLGLRPQRRFIIILLSYFPIQKMSRYLRIDWDRLIDCLMIWGVISSLLLIAQKLLYPSVQFIYALMNERNGSLRIYMDSTLIDLSVLIASYKFFKGLKIRHLFAAAIGLVYIAWVSQGRLEFISVVFGVGIGFVITRKLDRKKMLLWIALVVVLGVFLSSEFGEYLIGSIFPSKAEKTEYSSTMLLRYKGREWYFEQLFSSARSLLFGCGYPSSLYTPAMIKAGVGMKYYLIDNGVFGFFYVHGLFGLLPLAYMLIKAFKMAKVLRVRDGDNVPIMYLGMICLMAYNIIFWYWNADGTFILVLMLCYMENKCIEKVPQLDAEKA